MSLYFRIHSVLRLGKGNLMATCPTYFLTLQNYRKCLYFSSVVVAVRKAILYHLILQNVQPYKGILMYHASKQASS